MTITLPALCAAALALAACAAPLPPPAYQQPSESQAKKAYRDALRNALREPGDKQEGPPPGDESGLEAMMRGGRIERAARIENDNETILGSIDTLIDATPVNCVWAAFDRGELPGTSDETDPTYPDHAWRCGVTIVHDTARRGNVQADTEGFFYMRDDRYVYAGKAAHGFRASRDIAAGL